MQYSRLGLYIEREKKSKQALFKKEKKSDFITIILFVLLFVIIVLFIIKR